MIKLDDKFIIEYDGNQYLLQEKYIVKTGKGAGGIGYKNTTYHPTLSSAIESYLRKCQADIARSGIYSLSEACQQLEQEQKRCQDIIKELESIR